MVALIAASAAATVGLVGSDSTGARSSGGGSAQPTALVVDAAQARHGRDLVDARLNDLDAQVRLPRTGAEARTDVGYFAAQDYRLVVAGPRASAAAANAGVTAVRASGLETALTALGP